MTRLNSTFQESSPLITYSGWVEGSPANDTLSTSYDGSFKVAFTEGATATLTFTGTAVSLFGAIRPNHGNYTVELDQQPLFEAYGGTTGANSFNKSLWHADNLEYTQHTVVLQNKPTAEGMFLDLDFVSIERQIGQEGDQIFQTTIDDASASVTYLGNWEMTTDDSTAYQGTLHSTNEANAKVMMTFRGCCVELYGQYANAPYSVTVDDRDPVMLAGPDVDLTPDFQHPRTLLYLIDGLPEGNHTVTLTNMNSSTNRPFFFDNAIVSSTRSISPDGPNSNSNSNTSSQDNIGTVVSAACGAAVAVILLLILAFFFMRRRRRHRASISYTSTPIEASEVMPSPFMIPVQSQLHSKHPSEDSSSEAGVYVPPSKPSKQLQRLDYYPRGTADLENPPHISQGPPSIWRSSSCGTDPLSMTNTTPSQTASKSTTYMRRRPDASEYATSEDIQHKAIQEEDAGVVISPSVHGPGMVLPPAYNPEWHHRE